MKMVEFELNSRVRFVGKRQEDGPRPGDTGFFRGISQPTPETVRLMLERGEPPQVFECNGRQHFVLLRELELVEEYDGMTPTTWDQCEWQPPKSETSGSN